MSEAHRSGAYRRQCLRVNSTCRITVAYVQGRNNGKLGVRTHTLAFAQNWWKIFEHLEYSWVTTLQVVNCTGSEMSIFCRFKPRCRTSKRRPIWRLNSPLRKFRLYVGLAYVVCARAFLCQQTREKLKGKYVRTLKFTARCSNKLLLYRCKRVHCHDSVVSLLCSCSREC